MMEFDYRFKHPSTLKIFKKSGVTSSHSSDKSFTPDAHKILTSMQPNLYP